MNPAKSHEGETAATTLKWYGWTDRGRVRQNNEDSFLGLQFDSREVIRLGKIGMTSLEKMDSVFAVSDGMGGEKAGEYASRIAVEKITTLLPRTFKQNAAGIKSGFEDVLSEVFGQIHHALAYLGSCYEEIAGMETTLTLGWFTPGWMYFGHIGDSRIYYLPAREGGIKQITHDDTHVGWLFRNGKLNEREARTHPGRHVLQKALGGSNQFVEPQVGAVACERGDTFLLCTDGLVNGMYDWQFLEMLCSPSRKEENLARQLVETSVKNDGKDNTTALVIRVM